jgi:hypothetical protein
MAHMGARYHDQFTAVAGQGVMDEVGARDEERIARIAASDAAGFWELVRENQDDLKWCGSVAVLHVPEGGSESAASCCDTSSGISTSAAW